MNSMDYKNVSDINFKYKPKRNNFFYKLGNSLLPKKETPLSVLQENVNNILAHQDYNNLALILENGYLLTDEQENVLLNQIIKICSGNNFSDEVIALKKRMDDGFLLSESFYVKLYLSPVLKSERIFFTDIKYSYNFKDEIAYYVKQQKIKEEERNIYTSPINYKILSNINDALKNNANVVQIFIDQFNYLINNPIPKENLKMYDFRTIFYQYRDFIYNDITESQKKDFIKLLEIFKKTYEIKNAQDSIYYIYNDLSNQLDIKKRNVFKKEKRKQEDIKKSIEQKEIEIKNSSKTYNTEEIEQIIKNTRKIYLPSKEIFVEENISFDNKENLPESSQKILLKIEKIYQKLSLSKNHLPIEENLNIERFVKQRIPEAVALFQSIDSFYQDSDNKEKNSTSLLNDSLLLILENLEQTNNDLNEKKLALLKTNSTYLQNYKK